MTDTKWTPGRWVSTPWSRQESQVVAIDADKTKHLICAGVLHGDAHLIAAAPDLYEALYDALLILEAEGCATDFVERALAKACGDA